jgi:photosystem II stability/assembly factor-like uncharacterized protein
MFFPSRAGYLAVVMAVGILLCASLSWATDSSLTITPQVSHTEVTLMGLHFHTAQLGWAVGAGGTILKTVDGGKTWKKTVSGTRSTRSGVLFEN